MKGLRTSTLLRVVVPMLVLSGCATVPQQSTEPAVAKSLATPDAEAPLHNAVRTPTRFIYIEPEVHQCLAMNLYWEARGEGRQGMIAVGSVVLNRVDDPRFPDTVCEVVRDGGETPPCQFSWWCDGRNDRPTQQQAWEESLEVARQLLVARVQDPTGGALFYHSTAISEPWHRPRELTARIGRHIFYR